MDHNEKEIKELEIKRILEELTLKETKKDKLKFLVPIVIINLLSITITTFLMSHYLASSLSQNLKFFIPYALIEALLINLISFMSSNKIKLYGIIILMILSIYFTLSVSNLWLYIHFQSKVAIIIFFLFYYVFKTCIYQSKIKLI